MVRKGRLQLEGSLGAYLEDVARDVDALPIAPRVAAAVAALPDNFPVRDSADRIIYAKAGVHELALISAGSELRGRDSAVIW